MTAVALRVYADDLVTELATLDQPFDIAWTRERTDVGAGQFTIPHDAPIVQATPALLARDNLVVVTVDGQDEFAWIIRRRQRTRGDVWDPIQVTGPGALEILRHAIVYMRGGLDALVQGDERLFSWVSHDYDDSGPEWEEVDGDRIGAPLSTPGFADDRAVGFEPLSTTRHLYRRMLLASADLAGPARMLLAATIGTEVVVYLDDEEIMTKDAGEQGLVTLDIDYRDDIDQQIAVRVTGESGPQPGRWGWTWIELRENPDDPEGEPVYGSVIRRTFDPAEFPDADTPWLVYDDEGCPPITPGFVLGTAFDEWRDGDDRGGIAAITRDFTDTHDSAGNEWDGLCEFVAQVGDDNVVSIAERLQDHDVDVALGPDLVLRAWQRRGVDRGTNPDDGLATITFALDEVRELQTETEDEAVNVILARTEEAWIERPTPRVEANRREAFLSLGLTPSAEGGTAITDDVLADFLAPAQVVRFTINSAQSPPTPTGDFDLGDTVVAPWVDPDTIAAAWVEADQRVDTIAASIDTVGDVDWVLEVSP